MPAPELEWLINGKRVAQDSLHKVVVRENNVHSFLIERASPMDEGQYTIKASNKAGCVLTHIQLHVTRKTNCLASFAEISKTIVPSCYKRLTVEGLITTLMG